MKVFRFPPKDSCNIFFVFIYIKGIFTLLSMKKVIWTSNKVQNCISLIISEEEKKDTLIFLIKEKLTLSRRSKFSHMFIRLKRKSLVFFLSGKLYFDLLWKEWLQPSIIVFSMAYKPFLDIFRIIFFKKKKKMCIQRKTLKIFRVS